MTTPDTTRAALHGQLDALLSPAPVAPAAGGSVVPVAGAGSLVDELQGVLDTTAAARRALAARSDQAGASLSEAGSYDADLYESDGDSTMYDPPMEADPLGLEFRMAELREAIDARMAPRQVAPVDPHAEGRAVRLTVSTPVRFDPVIAKLA